MTLFADTNILVDSFKLDIYKDFLALEDDIYMESSMLEDEVLNPPTYADELRTCGLKTTDMTDEEFVLAVERESCITNCHFMTAWRMLLLKPEDGL